MGNKARSARSMAVKTIVEDYLLAATLRAKHERGEGGTIVLTVPEFPGLVACGSDARGALNELYSRLENVVLKSVERGQNLPVLPYGQGVIDLNAPENRALVSYHRGHRSAPSAENGVEINDPEALEQLFDRLPEPPSSPGSGPRLE
jgi:hypothetical protein